MANSLFTLLPPALNGSTIPIKNFVTGTGLLFSQKVKKNRRLTFPFLPILSFSRLLPFSSIFCIHHPFLFPPSFLFFSSLATTEACSRVESEREAFMTEQQEAGRRRQVLVDDLNYKLER